MSTATRWVVDPATTSAESASRTWGLVKVRGHFDRIHGWLEVDDNGSRRLELIIDATSVNTGNRKRDEHLLGSDFFDTERHPDVRFVSNQISDVDDSESAYRGNCSPPATGWHLKFSPPCGRSKIGSRSTRPRRSTSAILA
jgi:polyisoprenoid-binding protein YceI